MPLAKEIASLKERALAELSDAHDYYNDSKMIWRFVRADIQAGRKITIRNIATFSITNETRLAEKAERYVAGQLAEATFSNLYRSSRTSSSICFVFGCKDTRKVSRRNNSNSERFSTRLTKRRSR